MIRATLALAILTIALAAAPGYGQESSHLFHTVHGGPHLYVLGRVQTGSLPKSVTISPDGTRLVVCSFGLLGESNLEVFDASTLARISAAHFEGRLVESVVSPDMHTLYVSNFRRALVHVLDFPSLEPRGEIAVGPHPKFMTLSPDGATLYVANWGRHSVSVVDTATSHEVRRLETGRNPRGLALRNDGSLLAAAFHDDVVHVFAAGAAAESTRWEMCQLPRHLLLSPDGATMYVTCSMGFVGVYDAHTGRMRGHASTGRNPRTIAMNGDGRWIGVANFTSSDVSLFDTVQRRHRTYDVEGSRQIVGLAMDPGARPRLYATSWRTNELIVLGERDELASAD